jgi:protein-disulfide isomerase
MIQHQAGKARLERGNAAICHHRVPYIRAITGYFARQLHPILWLLKGLISMKTLLQVVVATLLGSLLAGAQDMSVLKPPKGAKAAIIVFEDLQCPQCSRAAPQVEKASATYKIPVIRHDFPLPKHDWSMNAALIARYFDQTSKDLGNQFRDYMFQNQPQITPDNLRRYADTFAGAHKMSLPFVIDPQGKLAALIDQDKNLGQQIHLDHTPTIYIVSAKPGVQPVEVPSDLNQLYSLIDSTMKQ